jgi:hypothetical protein
MAAASSLLLIVERAYRGAVETQFSDVLFFVKELNRQSGGADLALRGLAASYALDTSFVPAIRIAGRTLATLTDPRQGVRDLIADGAAVWVEEPDLTALGPQAAGRLLPGVRCLARHGLAARWPEYERVWFM